MRALFRQLLDEFAGVGVAHEVAEAAAVVELDGEAYDRPLVVGEFQVVEHEVEDELALFFAVDIVRLIDAVGRIDEAQAHRATHHTLVALVQVGVADVDVAEDRALDVVEVAAELILRLAARHGELGGALGGVVAHGGMRTGKRPEAVLLLHRHGHAVGHHHESDEDLPRVQQGRERILGRRHVRVERGQDHAEGGRLPRRHGDGHLVVAFLVGRGGADALFPHLLPFGIENGIAFGIVDAPIQAHLYARQRRVQARIVLVVLVVILEDLACDAIGQRRRCDKTRDQQPYAERKSGSPHSIHPYLQPARVARRPVVDPLHDRRFLSHADAPHHRTARRTLRECRFDFKRAPRFPVSTCSVFWTSAVVRMRGIVVTHAHSAHQRRYDRIDSGAFVRGGCR